MTGRDFLVSFLRDHLEKLTELYLRRHDKQPGPQQRGRAHGKLCCDTISAALEKGMGTSVNNLTVNTSTHQTASFVFAIPKYLDICKWDGFIVSKYTEARIP